MLKSFFAPLAFAPFIQLFHRHTSSKKSPLRLGVVLLYLAFIGEVFRKPFSHVTRCYFDWSKSAEVKSRAPKLVHFWSEKSLWFSTVVEKGSNYHQRLWLRFWLLSVIITRPAAAAGKKWNDLPRKEGLDWKLERVKMKDRRGQARVPKGVSSLSSSHSTRLTHYRTEILPSINYSDFRPLLSIFPNEARTKLPFSPLPNRV